MRKQKWRKDSVIVSFLCPVELLAKMDDAVIVQKKRTRKTPLNRSSWIIRAVQRDLDHTRRGRRSSHAKVDSRPEVTAEGQGGSDADLGVSVDIRQPQAGMGLGTSEPIVGHPNADAPAHLGSGVAGQVQVPSDAIGAVVEVWPVLPAPALAPLPSSAPAAAGG